MKKSLLFICFSSIILILISCGPQVRKVSTVFDNFGNSIKAIALTKPSNTKVFTLYYGHNGDESNQDSNLIYSFEIIKLDYNIDEPIVIYEETITDYYTDKYLISDFNTKSLKYNYSFTYNYDPLIYNNPGKVIIFRLVRFDSLNLNYEYLSTSFEYYLNDDSNFAFKTLEPIDSYYFLLELNTGNSQLYNKMYISSDSNRDISSSYSDPIRVNYRFLGWYLLKDDVYTLFNLATSKLNDYHKNEVITLYAKWEIIDENKNEISNLINNYLHINNFNLAFIDYSISSFTQSTLDNTNVVIVTFENMTLEEYLEILLNLNYIGRFSKISKPNLSYFSFYVDKNKQILVEPIFSNGNLKINIYNYLDYVENVIGYLHYDSYLNTFEDFDVLDNILFNYFTNECLIEVDGDRLTILLTDYSISELEGYIDYLNNLNIDYQIQNNEFSSIIMTESIDIYFDLVMGTILFSILFIK